MYTAKPTSRFFLFSILFLILVVFFISASTSETTSSVEDGDDVEGIEELLALDDDEEEELDNENKHKPPEAEVLSKAQKLVLELNIDTAKKVVEGNEYVLVLGYAPWDPKSAELMPRFAEAANVLKELGSQLLMAKIDAERYPKAASSLGIKGFPTLLLFINGTSYPYPGSFTSEEIVIWTRKKTGAPVIRVNSVTEANEFLEKHSTFVVGLFEDFEGSEYKEFLKAASLDNEFQFVETSTTEIVKVLLPDSEPAKFYLGLAKSEPEKYIAFEDVFDADKILLFLDDNKFPLVIRLTELNSAKVYSSTRKHQVYVFAEADELDKLVKPLEDVARKFKSKIMLVLVDINDDNLAKPFLTLFGLEESDDTVVVSFNYNISTKYLLESTTPTQKEIEGFCLGLLHGTVSPFFKSQPAPDNKNASILTVVGKTFDDLVTENPKNVILEVHTPWCINCETTSKQVEKLAKHFAGLDNLVFARIDASLNEHPKLQVDEYPALLLYPVKDKSNPIKLLTKSSSKELAAIINKHLKDQDQLTKDEL